MSGCKEPKNTCPRFVPLFECHVCVGLVDLSSGVSCFIGLELPVSQIPVSLLQLSVLFLGTLVFLNRISGLLWISYFETSVRLSGPHQGAVRGSKRSSLISRVHYRSAIDHHRYTNTSITVTSNEYRHLQEQYKYPQIPNITFQRQLIRIISNTNNHQQLNFLKIQSCSPSTHSVLIPCCLGITVVISKSIEDSHISSK